MCDLVGRKGGAMGTARRGLWAVANPRPDLRVRDGGRVPQQLRRRPVPLHAGEELLLAFLVQGGIVYLCWCCVDVGIACNFAELGQQIFELNR